MVLLDCMKNPCDSSKKPDVLVQSHMYERNSNPNLEQYSMPGKDAFSMPKTWKR